MKPTLNLKFTTGGEIIRFDPSIAGKTITLDSTLYVWKRVTIEGPAGAGITIDGGGHDRVIMVKRPAHVALRNLATTGANPGDVCPADG